MDNIADCDIVDFSQTVFREVRLVIATIVSKERLPVLCTVGIQLYIASSTLGHRDDSPARLRDTLDVLEAACQHPVLPTHHEYPRLRTLAAHSNSRDHQTTRQVEDALRLCALNLIVTQGTRRRRVETNTDQNPLTRLLQVLANFTETGSADAQRKTTPQDVVDYHPNVNDVLYKVLERQLSCYCMQDFAEFDTHPTRLCLKPEIVLHEDHALFDTYILGRPQTPTRPQGNWQQIRFLVPSKGKIKKKKVAFSRHETVEQRSLFEINAPPLTQNEFCEVVNQDYGPIRICFMTTQQGAVLALDEHIAGDHVKSCSSVSLTHLLLNHQLTGKMKLTIAYILAHSIWQFYSSDWMKFRWSTDSIHFVKEYAADSVGAPDLLFACNACFVVEFSNVSEEVVEYHKGYVAHRYPRLVALGNILIDIGRAEPRSLLHGDTPQTMVQQINADCSAAKYTFRDKSWPSLGSLRSSSSVNPISEYKYVVERCFDHKLFSQERTAGAQKQRVSCKIDAAQQTIEERRAIVHAEIVTPLKALLDSLGWTAALTEKVPILDPLHQNTTPIAPQPSYRQQTEPVGVNQAFLGADSAQRRSDTWVKATQGAYLQAVQPYILGLQLSNYQRIKVAVLDTGYDPQSVFFTNRDRKPRLKGWKDWVTEAETKVDEDGHGSKVLSLVMKMAPLADIYFARVAKNSDGLKHSSATIAEAIKWASTVWDVDVISMSFGFAQEELVKGESLVSNAIYEAVSKRKDKILFFGAVGNEGANIERARFPARHYCVIPVYGTDARGAFLDSLNPRIEFQGPVIHGTLAQDVPCTGLSHQGAVIDTGTSFATAIAAGMAASLLEYVQLREAVEGNLLWKDSLLKRHAMLELFWQMFETPADRRYYLNPAQWFQKSPDVRRADIVKAIDNSK